MGGDNDHGSLGKRRLRHHRKPAISRHYDYGTAWGQAWVNLWISLEVSESTGMPNRHETRLEHARYYRAQACFSGCPYSSPLQRFFPTNADVSPRFTKENPSCLRTEG